MGFFIQVPLQPTFCYPHRIKLDLQLIFSFEIATWLDEALSAVAFKLEHPAQQFPEFKSQAVVGLHVCDLYTCVQLANGSLFWW